MGRGLHPTQGCTVPAQYTWPGTHTLGDSSAPASYGYPSAQGKGGQRLAQGAGRAGRVMGRAHHAAANPGGTPCTYRLARGPRVPRASGASWCSISSGESLQDRGASYQRPADSGTAGPRPPVPQAVLVLALGAQDSPMAEPGLWVLSWGVREHRGAGPGLPREIPSPAWVRRRRREQRGAERDPCGAGPGDPGAVWVRGLEVLTLSPFLPGCSTLSPGRPRGPTGPGGPGSPWRPWRDSREDRLGGRRWPRHILFSVVVIGAEQVPALAPTHQQDKGTWGPCSCPPPGSGPPVCPLSRTLPARQGGPAALDVLAVPAEKK